MPVARKFKPVSSECAGDGILRRVPDKNRASACSDGKAVIIRAEIQSMDNFREQALVSYLKQVRIIPSAD